MGLFKLLLDSFTCFFSCFYPSNLFNIKNAGFFFLALGICDCSPYSPYINMLSFISRDYVFPGETGS